MEVLTVLAIISVVSSIIFPAIDNFYSNDRVQATALMLISDIRMARYKAIEDQRYFRLVFSADPLTPDIIDGYKIEAYIGQDENDNTTTEPITNLENYDNTDWESILGEEEVSLDFGVDIRKTGLPNCIYFWPSGLLVTRRLPNTNALDDTHITPIAEGEITFGYGNAGIKILVNAYGVFTSETYQPDEDAEDYDPDSLTKDEIW